MSYKEGLFELRNLISDEDFQAELQVVVEAIVPRTRDLHVLSRQKRMIEQDMEQDLEADAHDAKRTGDEDPSLEFFERAYLNSLVPRVMGASSKNAKVTFSKTRPSGVSARSSIALWRDQPGAGSSVVLHNSHVVSQRTRESRPPCPQNSDRGRDRVSFWSEGDRPQGRSQRNVTP